MTGEFTRLEHGPYGLRWSYTYDPDSDCPPTIAEAEAAIGVKLATRTQDASGEREDGLAEEVYFAAEEISENTLETYRVQ